MSEKVNYEIEFPVKASPAMLFPFLSTPSGMSEWFCDDVNSRGELFTFFWDDSEETAKLIKKKPKGVRARPTFVEYKVNYQNFNGKWHLAAVQASIKIRIKSKRDRLNSEFHSVSDLLVTDIQNTTLKRFHRTEALKRGDVFVEMIDHYDEQFWENYNTIKPDEDLRKAFKNSMKSTK